MNRAGYVDDFDDQWELIMWRGAVKSAIRGQRGQRCLREMLEALDALPKPRLIRNELEADGEYCALGALGRKRGIDVSRLDPEDYDRLADEFGIAPALVREIEYINDDAWVWEITPEKRFAKVRDWITKQIKDTEQS